MLGFAVLSAARLFGQTFHFDMDANAYYVNTFPKPKYWDTSLTEKKRLYVIDVDTTADILIVGWRTEGDSGRVKYGDVAITKGIFYEFINDELFTYIATFLKLEILE